MPSSTTSARKDDDVFNSHEVTSPSRARLLIYALASLLCCERLAIADTHTATDLTPEAVWEAIDTAQDGDTVELPAGTADWSKGWNTGRGARMKAITI